MKKTVLPKEAYDSLAYICMTNGLDAPDLDTDKAPWEVIEEIEEWMEKYVLSEDQSYWDTIEASTKETSKWPKWKLGDYSDLPSVGKGPDDE